ncbi:MAG TPA: chemotaxis protein [Nevskiaceae bacterium]|nr:chemotaxis protein [Nevskiaceae bacterium]
MGLLDSIDRSTQLAGHNRLALLLFRLGSRQIFGVNVLKVQEVVATPPLQQPVAMHPWLRGWAGIRGRVVPAIDLAAPLGLPRGEGRRLIVAEYNRSVQGFVVESVERILQVDVATVRPPSAGESGFFTGVTRWGEEPVALIDLEKLLVDVMGAPPEAELVIEEGLGEGWKVLVADDSRVARQQIERLLRRLGLEVVSVHNGREALDWLRARSPAERERLAMLISDVEMPEMDGYRLTTEIRRDASLAGLHVLLHSSLSGRFNETTAEKVGADAFVAKFSETELAEHVQAHLRGLLMQA